MSKANRSVIMHLKWKPWALFVAAVLSFIIEYPFTDKQLDILPLALIFSVLGICFLLDSIITKIKYHKSKP